MNAQFEEITSLPAGDAHGLSRRRFLAGLSALGVSALLSGCQTTSNFEPGKPYRIDVHHHFAPPGYSAELKALMQGHAKWSVEATLDEMEKSGIATAFTSLINPGMQAWGADPAGSRKIARISNEYAAQLMRDYPGRFGSFASIPFPDIEASLREIEYAYDTLKADGIYLWTSYGGKLLGDPAFFPILAELNRRKAVIYTHPATPACCANIMPYISINAIEGPVDTTRTMMSLIFQGGAAKFPDIRWIFSHSGGVTPFLLSRFQREEVEKDRKNVLPHGLMHELRKFHYDTAQGHHEGALKALRSIIPTSQILYGTDYPFWDGRRVSSDLAKGGFSAAERVAIDRDNAARLFPRLKT
ncbi:MAG TPA: amidohydrolase family protein [Burkholderiales bacterium]|nr:amidohydrolase family protein [Burkholderiales bacterium]